MKNKYSFSNCILLAILVVIAFYIFSNYSKKSATTSTDLNTLNEKIVNTVRLEADNIYQCKSMPTGSMACGGPSSYTIYSTKNTNVDKLINLVKTYSETEDANNIRDRAVSTCVFLQEPELEIVDGLCVAKYNNN